VNRLSTLSITASPVLVGAVTVLIAAVAVILSYNANQGLPFVPTQELNAQVSSGANVVVGNDVRSGGYRIGVVADMVPARFSNGRVGALMKLKLDRKFGEVPVDTRLKIRARSALGLKYVEVTRGRSRRMLPNGATLPERQATVPVELDEFFNMFDEPTRKAAQEVLRGSGDTFAGRGVDLNRFILAAPDLFKHLRSVAANLNSPRTRLRRLNRELEDAARAVVPVADAAARGFTGMADTFGALSRDREALKETIAKGPATMDVGTRSLRVQRPFLTDLAGLSADLNGATVELRRALPPANRALAAGIPVLPRSVALSDRLARTLDATRDLAVAPTTNGALRGLTATVATLQPTLRYVGPFVTVCNSWNQFWTFVAEHFTAPDETGEVERILSNNGAIQEDDITAMGANEFAHGGPVVAPINGGRPQILHFDDRGNRSITASGDAHCKAGQSGYMYRGNRFAPDQQHYGRAVVDQPADSPRRGPTFKRYDKQGKGFGLNPDHVPAGQTFTNVPGGRGVTP
jgi:phospholipid/cholesterol/gamma-HCH transport system substrate-binding protein